MVLSPSLTNETISRILKSNPIKINKIMPLEIKRLLIIYSHADSPENIRLVMMNDYLIGEYQ
jgi:hypothetical protein